MKAVEVEVLPTPTPLFPFVDDDDDDDLLLLMNFAKPGTNTLLLLVNVLLNEFLGGSLLLPPSLPLPPPEIFGRLLLVNPRLWVICEDYLDNRPPNFATVCSFDAS